MTGKKSLTADSTGVNNDKLEQMEKREGRERYVDIVNVHAAALN